MKYINLLMYLITGIGIRGPVNKRKLPNYWHEPEAEVYMDMTLALVETRKGERWMRALAGHIDNGFKSRRRWEDQ